VRPHSEVAEEEEEDRARSLTCGAVVDEARGPAHVLVPVRVRRIHDQRA